MRPSDIIFLQETHSTALDEIIYSRVWRGARYWSHCDSRSAGTAILFSDKFQPTISQIVQDDNGPYIIVIIESLDNIPYALCNVYAPSGGTHKSLRKEFFSQLEQTLKDFNLTNYIIGGDFNCILDDSLDRNIPPTGNSDAAQRNLFLRSLHKFFFTHANLIVCGDFNSYDNVRDNFGGNPALSSDFSNLKSNLGLIDAWRFKNPRLSGLILIFL